MCHYFANYWPGVVAYHWIQNDLKLPIRYIFTLPVYDMLGKKAKLVQVGNFSYGFPFKLRYGNHKKSFQHEKYKSETTLSSYVWDQGLNPTPNISWRFLKTCSVYETGRRHCDLCLSEKEFIIRNMNKQNSINKRTDIGNRCPHRRRRTLEFYHEWTCAVGVVRCLSLSSLTQEALLLHCGSAPWTDVWEWLHIRPGPEESLGLKVD